MTDQERYEKEISSRVEYKAHLFQSLGNNKLSRNATQCGRNLWQNQNGTHVVKTGDFKNNLAENEKSVCVKRLKWAKENGKI